MTMTAKELYEAIGKVVDVRYEQLEVRCEVIDAKMAYGNPRLQVRPIAGQGLQWVDFSRIIRRVDGGVNGDGDAKAAGLLAR